jgi:hypothetical protein
MAAQPYTLSHCAEGREENTQRINLRMCADPINPATRKSYALCSGLSEYLLREVTFRNPEDSLDVFLASHADLDVRLTPEAGVWI